MKVIKLNESNLRKVVSHLLTEYGDIMYQVGREDALTGLPPQDEDPDYMLGYNDAIGEQGSPPESPPRGADVHADWRKSLLGDY